MKIKSESQLTDPSIRKKIIEEIESGENKARKNRAWRRQQAYKDKVSALVVEMLLMQFAPKTVLEMQYSIANISIVRKIIDKLARVYSHGVDRSITGNDEATKALGKIVQRLNLQSALKSTNQMVKLHRNAALFLKPCPVYETSETTPASWRIVPEVLQPYLFDVVEDEYDRTRAIGFILSDFQPSAFVTPSIPQTNPGAVHDAPISSYVPGNQKDESIANSPMDKHAGEKKTYIFWSKNYHFTCDETGNLIAGPNGQTETKNPIGLCPILSYAIGQDGAFWADGGDDLIDGAVLVNSLLTHTAHIGVTQGYGQFYAIGSNLPRSFEFGPNKAIIGEYSKEQEQAEPKFGFMNANPPMTELESLVEMYIALLLTTNNLSTSGVKTQLEGGGGMASGIALVIDKAESLEDVQDQRQIFVDKEPEIFMIIAAEVKAFSAQLQDKELSSFKVGDDFAEKFSLKFHDAQAMQTESEKLANLKARKELGLDTAISLLMKDDPSLSLEQAQEKLKKILEERLKETLMNSELAKKHGVPNDQKDDGGDGSLPGEKDKDNVDPADVTDEDEDTEEDAE